MNNFSIWKHVSYEFSIKTKLSLRATHFTVILQYDDKFCYAKCFLIQWMAAQIIFQRIVDDSTNKCYSLCSKVPEEYPWNWKYRNVGYLVQRVGKFFIGWYVQKFCFGYEMWGLDVLNYGLFILISTDILVYTLLTCCLDFERFDIIIQ